ncbi:MAG: hypothetical protein GY938_30660 [Ketobacter sp.]|nr:hypothetical protein [Ketobacter sp.]
MNDITEEINKLPKRLRDYIHDLETDCDPAGTIREVFALKENQKVLESTIRMLEAESEYE